MYMYAVANTNLTNHQKNVAPNLSGAPPLG